MKKRIAGRKREREIKKLLSNKKRKLNDLKFPLLPKLPPETAHPPIPIFPPLQHDTKDFLTKEPFTSLPFHQFVSRNLLENGYTHLTPIQYVSLPHLMLGKDVCAEAPTGTGKTLAFLLPIIDRALRLGFLPEHGVCGLILCPTRELALQIYWEAQRLTLETPLSCALLTGGGNKLKESKLLGRGVNIAVGTPGRVLDHLIHTDFNRRNMQFLVLDEADRMVLHGFGTDLKAILYKFFSLQKKTDLSSNQQNQAKKKKKKKKKSQPPPLLKIVDEDEEDEEEEEEQQNDMIPPPPSSSSSSSSTTTTTTNEQPKSFFPLPQGKIQRVLFSATIGDEVRDISRRLLNLEEEDVVNLKISRDRSDSLNVTSSVSHGYVTIPEREKFLLLMSFLRSQKKKKIIVFFATCTSVKFFSTLMYHLNPIFRKRVCVLHGEMGQRDRTRVFTSFRGDDGECGNVLFSTNLCARGMDIGDVGWIVQFDPPNDLRDYVHRVGRTGRAGKVGKAVLFLTPIELGVLGKFEEIGITVRKLELGNTRLVNVQAAIEEVVEKNYEALNLAHKAFQVKLYSYKSYPFKDIFSLDRLDMEGLARQYGLDKVPYVPLEERNNEQR